MSAPETIVDAAMSAMARDYAEMVDTIAVALALTLDRRLQEQDGRSRRRQACSLPRVRYV
jgi:hypothetical protein